MPTTVDREQVQQLMAEGAQIVEVLPQAEYVDEHLTGAINIPLKQLDRDASSRRSCCSRSESTVFAAIFV